MSPTFTYCQSYLANSVIGAGALSIRKFGILSVLALVHANRTGYSYLCLSVTRKRFRSRCTLQQGSLKKLFLSHVRSRGVEKFLNWKAEHEAKGDTWWDESYNQQHTSCSDTHFWQSFDYEMGFDNNFCEKVIKLREC